MEYVYSALLLHKAGTEINDANMKKVLKAAKVKVDEARIKAIVAALKGVDIESAISKAAPVATASAPAASGGAPAKGDKKEEKKDEEPEVSEAEAAAGLGSLFG